MLKGKYTKIWPKELLDWKFCVVMNTSFLCARLEIRPTVLDRYSVRSGEVTLEPFLRVVAMACCTVFSGNLSYSILEKQRL